jgi:uncharacterized tellurite resistance protein B-like protein
MKTKTEFIESIYYLALEMGVADGEVTDLEMNSINRVIHDCMKYSDANNNVFSKKSLVEVNDVKIFTVWMNNFFDNQTMQFLNTHIESLSVLPRETKKLILNALWFVAKVDENVAEGEVSFFMHLKQCWKMDS